MARSEAGWLAGEVGKPGDEGGITTREAEGRMRNKR